MDQAHRRQEHQARPADRSRLKRFAYTCDFGANWEHTLTIEAIGDADAGLDYPRFVDGARRAPLEDVGGITGFGEFVEAMVSRTQSLIEWYGRVFEPEDIDLPTVEANIAKLARRRVTGKAAFAKSRPSGS